MIHTDTEDARIRARDGAPGATKTGLAAGAGTCVENYDFLAYGTASALYFGDVFFPDSDPTVGTLLSFATLGVGFLVRPLGGLLGGYLADRFGRKPVLMGALLVMGIATMLIGLLPTYASVGILAPILLVFVRVVQGLAFGAEWGGAIIITYEHAPWRRRGFFTALPQAGAPLGVGIASLTFLVSTALPGDLAWRVPFLASVVLIVVGLIVRMTLNESPEFEEMKEQDAIAKNPLTKVVREDWRTILRIIALRVVESCGYYITVTYVLSYVTKNDLAPRSVAIMGAVVGSFIAVGMVLFFGRLSDRFGRRPIYMIACIAVGAYGFPVFWLVNTGQPVLIVGAFAISIGLIWAGFAGIQGSWFSELFSITCRASGASIGYQFAASLSGFAPFIAALLASRYGWHGPAAFIVVIALVGVLGVLSTKETLSRARREEIDAYIAGGPLSTAHKSDAHRIEPVPTA